MIEHARIIEAAAARAMLQHRRETAVDALAAAFRACATPAWQACGDAAEVEMRNEAHRLVDFFEAALVSYGNEPLVRYLLWLRQVLSARQAAPDAVPYCLDQLEQVFADAASASARAALFATLREVQYALRWHRSARDWRVHSPPNGGDYLAFEAALLAGDCRQARQLFQRSLDHLAHPVAVAVDLLQPALYSIGCQWQNNQISVAQEHRATAIVEALLATLPLSPAAADAPTALLALAPGNRHGVGLRVVADAFARAGWQTRTLPAGSTLPAIIDAVAQDMPRVLALSAAMAHHLLSTRLLFARLRRLHGVRAPLLLLGGLAVAEYPDIAARQDGVLFCPDLRTLGQCLPRLDKVA
ncbi:cobalamin B12-binding domain-containing protein [Algiphilus sp.]|uniref:cobalamin B12-binding domain-containing protein n=1 Tax=Algiphilus sp. TaxID=1872431 RepID=UPI003BABBCA8